MTHPGMFVRQECLDPNGLSATNTGQVLGCNFLNERSGISPEMALRLEKAFGTSGRPWMERQMNHELETVMARAYEIDVQSFTKRPSCT
ncbi:HigA family addiction module antitoxin [Acetobacter vaccinii]|nr:HigA family addiction module antitoxin [Acetobacter vaccinii]